jgi:hypothetical protein
MRALAGPVLAAGVAFGFQALAQERTAKPEAPVVKQVTAEFPKGDRLEARIMTATIQLRHDLVLAYPPFLDPFEQVRLAKADVESVRVAAEWTRQRPVPAPARHLSQGGFEGNLRSRRSVVARVPKVTQINRTALLVLT